MDCGLRKPCPVRTITGWGPHKVDCWLCTAGHTGAKYNGVFAANPLLYQGHPQWSVGCATSAMPGSSMWGGVRWLCNPCRIRFPHTGLVAAWSLEQNGDLHATVLGPQKEFGDATPTVSVGYTILHYTCKQVATGHMRYQSSKGDCSRALCVEPTRGTRNGTEGGRGATAVILHKASSPPLIPCAMHCMPQAFTSLHRR